MTGGQFVDRGDRGGVERKKKSDGVYDLLRFAAHVSAVGDNVRGWPMMRQTWDSQKRLSSNNFAHPTYESLCRGNSG